MMKLVENTAILVAGTILIIAMVIAVAVLFFFAALIVMGRKLKPRRDLTMLAGNNKAI